MKQARSGSKWAVKRCSRRRVRGCPTCWEWVASREEGCDMLSRIGMMRCTKLTGRMDGMQRAEGGWRASLDGITKFGVGSSCRKAVTLAGAGRSFRRRLPRQRRRTREWRRCGEASASRGEGALSLATTSGPPIKCQARPLPRPAGGTTKGNHMRSGRQAGSYVTDIPRPRMEPCQ